MTRRTLRIKRAPKRSSKSQLRRARLAAPPGSDAHPAALQDQRSMASGYQEQEEDVKPQVRGAEWMCEGRGCCKRSTACCPGLRHMYLGVAAIKGLYAPCTQRIQHHSGSIVVLCRTLNIMFAARRLTHAGCLPTLTLTPSSPCPPIFVICRRALAAAGLGWSP